MTDQLDQLKKLAELQANYKRVQDFDRADEFNEACYDADFAALVAYVEGLEKALEESVTHLERLLNVTIRTMGDEAHGPSPLTRTIVKARQALKQEG